MSRRILTSILIGMLLLASPFGVSAVNRELILCKVNEERVKVGLQPLAEDDVLVTTAESACADRAKAQDTCSPESEAALRERLDTGGFKTWLNVGQAAVSGAINETDCVNKWMADPTDRAQILDKDYIRFGGSVVYENGVSFWVGIFGNDGNAIGKTVEVCPQGQDYPVPGEPGYNATSSGDAPSSSANNTLDMTMRPPSTEIAPPPFNGVPAGGDIPGGDASQPSDAALGPTSSAAYTPPSLTYTPLSPPPPSAPYTPSAPPASPEPSPAPSPSDGVDDANDDSGDDESGEKYGDEGNGDNNSNENDGDNNSDDCEDDGKKHKKHKKHNKHH